jgi:serine/threonine protein kinase
VIVAPEQLEGQEADPRTDIFAFGAVVYEMITGKKAFAGKSQASLISAIMSFDRQRYQLSIHSLLRLSITSSENV